jgi:hypothetical protein
MSACPLGASARAGGMTVDELQAGFDKLPTGDVTRGE